MYMGNDALTSKLAALYTDNLPFLQIFGEDKLTLWSIQGTSRGEEIQRSTYVGEVEIES
jgi:hypothetical protein